MTTTTSNVTPDSKMTDLPESTKRRILRGLDVRENASGMYIVDADDQDGAKWWPNERCDDDTALALAYEAGLGSWHT